MLVSAARLPDTLKKYKAQGYRMLLGIICVDITEDIEKLFELTYIIYNLDLKHKRYIKVRTSYVLQSVSSIYSSANYEEREIYDLFGIFFEEHPHLERILMVEGTCGHPLCKDYVEEDERVAWRK